MSQGERPISQKPSVRPAATQARSRAAEPGRRTPAQRRVTLPNMRMYSSKCANSRNGKPVPMSASSSLSRPLTRMRRSFMKAPAPRVAVKSSLRFGSKTTACWSTPLWRSAIDTQYCGKPCRKLVVPSRGSMIQRCSASAAFGEVPLSSPRNACEG